ncbi:MAG: nitroreductase/quinone reductase family protein [Anaerolineales bacterium]
MWYNPLVIWLLRSPLHGLLSGNTLLVTYAGRKSGKAYTFPISYARDGDLLLLITHRRKLWWKNILGGAPVTLRIRGHDQPAVAQVADVDRETLLAEMLKVYHGMPRPLAEKQLPDMVLVRLQLSAFPKS